MTALLRRRRDFVAPLCLLATMLAFAPLAPGFLELRNATNVLGQMAPLAIVALGEMAVIVTAGFDISVGGVVALSTVLTALSINALGPVGIVVGPATGLVCGALNGAMVGRLRLQPIIATLGMLSIARGLALSASHGETIVLADGNPLGWLGYGETAGLPNALLVTLALALAVLALTRRTRVGRRLYMIGSNRAAAGLVGVSASRTLLFAYALAGLSAGIAALVVLGRAGAGLPTEGTGLELSAIAAAVIGGTALTGGVGNPLVVLLGAAFVQGLGNGLNLAGTSPYAQELILGAVIVLAGLLDWLVRRAASIQRPRGGSAA